MKASLPVGTAGYRLRLLLALLFLPTFYVAMAQEAPSRCYTMEMDSMHRAKHNLPPLSEVDHWLNQKVIEYKARHEHQRAAVVTLPVVFHIIHSGEAVGTGNNISLEQIQSQIIVLNEDFRRTNPDASNTLSEFQSVAADAEVQFCLAGITRTNWNDPNWAPSYYTSCYVSSNIKPATIWDPNKYLNVWVVAPLRRCDSTGNLLGYSTWPEGSHGLSGMPGNSGTIANEDGVVCVPSSIGRPPANPFGGVYNQGRTATHELGHFFGLRHIWGDGNCSASDFCDDTPDSDAPNYGCPLTHQSCSTLDMVQNYMDYTDDLCMNLFTEDQKTRMRAVLDNSPRRNSLITAGTCCPTITASIAATKYNGADLSCHNSTNGQLTASSSGGVAPRTYHWSTGATSATISNLEAGTYRVTVSDANGCPGTASYTITAPPQVNATASATSNFNGYNISCNGGSNGVAEASPSGGVGGFSYKWSASAGGQTSKIATGLSAGSHGVTVTDANGCTRSASVTLTQPPAVQLTAEATSDYNGYNVSCHGGSDGIAEAYPFGGVGGFTYLWSVSAGSQATKVASNLPAGLHSVTATDANGCPKSASTTLTEPDPLVVNAGENQTVYYGYPDSACADLSYTPASGGVPPYTYQWSTGETTQAINVCPEVTTIYTITVTDKNGCVMTDEVKVCVINVLCTKGKGSPQIEICHESDEGDFITICLGIAAAPAHFAHGDRIAACDVDRSCDDLMAKTGFTEDDIQMRVYPNPFEAYTTIRFRAVHDGRATIRLMDISGREAMEIFNNHVLAGERYQINIPGEHMAAGIYFCILQFSDGTTRTEKLVFTPR